MATKTFCDLCHDEIKSGEARYVLKATRTNSPETLQERFAEGTEWVVDDVCNECVQRVTSPLPRKEVAR